MVTRRGKEEPGTNGSNKGKIKFRYMDSERVVDFSVENMAGESVTDGLHSIANALAGRTLLRKPAPDPKRTLAGGGAPAVDLEEEVETPELEEQEPEILEPEADDSTEDQTPKTKKTPKAPKAPKLLKEPNLTEAKVSLEDFMKQKAVTDKADMMDRYAVVAVWYKEQFQIDIVNIDRIYSAFTLLGQAPQLPTDVEKPLQNMTYTSKTKKWFDKAEGAGNYSLNWVGESAVGKMGAAKA
jgi:hypothetical protein